ncbi:hypothetical protein GGX14DRAFT_402065 [Mycena pura]|uniref:Uncharacterized protein n=1 Tax=Mycena pura TaxID=153505 RepID=A0AAD6UZ11_9AGAR|nr:hypothetical protein GGX14DRAFT_402065 [Mycena pura]
MTRRVVSPEERPSDVDRDRRMLRRRAAVGVNVTAPPITGRRDRRRGCCVRLSVFKYPLASGSTARMATGHWASDLSRVTLHDQVQRRAPERTEQHLRQHWCDNGRSMSIPDVERSESRLDLVYVEFQSTLGGLSASPDAPRTRASSGPGTPPYFQCQFQLHTHAELSDVGIRITRHAAIKWSLAANGRRAQTDTRRGGTPEDVRFIPRVTRRAAQLRRLTLGSAADASQSCALEREHVNSAAVLKLVPRPDSRRSTFGAPSGRMFMGVASLRTGTGSLCALLTPCTRRLVLLKLKLKLKRRLWIIIRSSGASKRSRDAMINIVNVTIEHDGCLRWNACGS